MFTILCRTFFFQAPYIKKCSVKDPNLAACCLKNGREAIPHMTNGVPQLHIPSLNPLILNEIQIQNGPDFKLKLTNVTIRGLDKAVLDQFSLDLTKKEGKLALAVDQVTMEAIYDIKGRLLVLPIDGTGPTTVKFGGIVFIVTFKYDTIKKGKKTYPKLLSAVIDYTTKTAEFELENLFNGDKALGDQMNLFLNENWRDIDNDIKPAIRGTLIEVILSYINNADRRIALNDIFLDFED